MRDSGRGYWWSWALSVADGGWRVCGDLHVCDGQRVHGDRWVCGSEVRLMVGASRYVFPPCFVSMCELCLGKLVVVVFVKVVVWSDFVWLLVWYCLV